MELIRTTKCAADDHRELTLVLSAPPSVPNLVEGLVNYFEVSVARGTQFKPGQTVLFGSSLLRITERDDGTLGVHALQAGGTWTEAVDSALMRTWIQQEVARSVGLTPAFTHQMTTVTACVRALEGTALYYLTRHPSKGGQDSGWWLGCGEQDHDHEVQSAWASTPIVELAGKASFLEQYLALPVGTEVFLDAMRWSVSGRGRPHAEVVHNGKKLDPRPESYLAAYNAKALEE